METTQVPIAKLHLPQAPLASCVFGAFARDTRKCDLPFEKRFSHFASSPFCGISWIFDGQSHLLENRAQMEDPASAPVYPKLAFTGPYQTPQTSWSDGGINSMILTFYPDAMVALTGVSISEYANQSVPVEEVLSGELLQLAYDVADIGEADAGFQLIEERLAPLWHQARPEGSMIGWRVSDWCKSLAIKAALSGVGKSTRQIERRVRAWAGQPLRRLNAYARSEDAFQHALAARAEGDLNFADISAELGYSDQSHMGRQVKEITGFSPAEFMKRYDEDETFWSFCLLGERF